MCVNFEYSLSYPNKTEISFNFFGKLFDKISEKNDTFPFLQSGNIRFYIRRFGVKLPSSTSLPEFLHNRFEPFVLIKTMYEYRYCVMVSISSIAISQKSHKLWLYKVRLESNM